MRDNLDCGDNCYLFYRPKPAESSHCAGGETSSVVNTESITNLPSTYTMANADPFLQVQA